MKYYEPFKKLLRTYIHLDNLKIETLDNEQDYERVYAQALPTLLPQLKVLCEEVQRCGRKMMLISLTVNGNSRQLLHLWNTHEVFDYQHSSLADFFDTEEDDWLDPWELMLDHYIWEELGDTDASYDYVNVGELENYALPEPLGWELIHPEIGYDEKQGRYVELE